MLKHKEKKGIILGILITCLLLLPLCTEKKEAPSGETKTTETVRRAEIPAAQSTEPTTTIASMPLDGLQIDACNNADAGGTCESKLKELNVVPIEDCCRYLGKCCT